LPTAVGPKTQTKVVINKSFVKHKRGTRGRI
jgi:hypothetical protein